MVAATCALVFSGAPVRSASASVDPAAPMRVSQDTISSSARDTIVAAARDTIVAAARDTTARARADTSAAAPKKALWTMDELKGVLGEETGRIKEGTAYKERKSGRVAMACAVLVPGLGQMYNEKPVKAGIALGLETFYLSQIAMNRRLREREKVLRDAHPAGSLAWKNHDRWVTEYWERSVDWIWWSGVVVLGIVIDAYVDAKLDDMRFKVEARASGGNVGVSLLVRY
jgi:hypothetical protein